MDGIRRIIDDKGRLFGVISYVDVIVLIMAATLVSVIFVKYSINESAVTTGNIVNVVYNVRVSEMRLKATELFRPGDKLYTSSNIYIGTIKAVDRADATVQSSLADGSYVNAGIEDRYDVTLTVEAQCSKINERFYADRVFEIHTNMDQPMMTKYNIFTGSITRITIL